LTGNGALLSRPDLDFFMALIQDASEPRHNQGVGEMRYLTTSLAQKLQ